MKARHAARELALLTLFQLDLPDSPQTGKDKLLADDTSLQTIMLSAVRSLIELSKASLEQAADTFQSVYHYMSEAEQEHPHNLNTPIDRPCEPVSLPNTREFAGKVEMCLKGIEHVWEAMRIPELAMLAEAKDVRIYALHLINLVIGNRPRLDEQISQASLEWRVERLAKIDRLILQLATAEMLFVPDVDVGVSIDEAVELAKEYSSEDSYRFINGVLGNLAKCADAKAGRV